MKVILLLREKPTKYNKTAFVVMSIALLEKRLQIFELTVIITHGALYRMQHDTFSFKFASLLPVRWPPRFYVKAR